LGSKRIRVTTDLSGERDMVSHVIIDSPQGISYWWSFRIKSLSLTVNKIFNGECDVMVDATSNDL